ncbi:MAG: hypothetical protein ACI9UA_003950 [Pseudoalteromonas tetraodonis]|jgi:hypothetical protein
MTHREQFERCINLYPLPRTSRGMSARDYLDFARLHRIGQAGSFFVILSQKNTKFSVYESRPVDRSTGFICDQSIRFSSAKGMKGYHEKLRRIGYSDEETGKLLTSLTNYFALPPITVAAIYKNRWKIRK